MTTGWKIDPATRPGLLEVFEPLYGTVVADHITLSADDSVEPESRVAAIIVGHADDGEGVEAYVVAINGSTTRPDGGTWHVTWSLADGRTAKESNDVIEEHGWTSLMGHALRVRPARW